MSSGGEADVKSQYNSKTDSGGVRRVQDRGIIGALSRRAELQQYRPW